MKNQALTNFLLTLIAMITVFTKPVAADDSFIAMTYNVRYLNTHDREDLWSMRRAKVAETIEIADVVGLQEVTAEQLRDVQAATPDWSWYGLGRDDGKEGGEFAPVGYRHALFEAMDHGTLWLSDTPTEAGSKGWDAALPRTMTWMVLRRKVDRKEFLVINSHFDHRGSKAREESGRLIAKEVDQRAQGRPTIVMGDFNANPDSAPLRALQSGSEVALSDAREVSVTDPEGPTGTWNGFKAIQSDRRIDHMLVSDQVVVQRYRVLDPKTEAGRFASDHLPVAIHVGWK
ncbi:endonuclease/exonuclease/phosphatase family protein [Rhodopirellula sp. JC740]|uniref:Endonuclease/exonuclease/phosphatase family protein n=1 Tax=Rhodopirellula halodulae TaxID=2894198 RepID=A0ABS8NKH5_9BACT|nr:endonuclease/exonuclease/phosphatase family protein [Rhodopirellula sp. JC740]MCC9643899.1 endonuclease/exonuclease/phosphatase family protein [Rhodopirellula sp. JC740]